jgi:hypothetical protein
MSSCTQASTAASSAVNAPIHATMASTSWCQGEQPRRPVQQVHTPAVTIVAAWINAETGVGPSIASGNQTWNGNWADLPIAPR